MTDEDAMGQARRVMGRALGVMGLARRRMIRGRSVTPSLVLTAACAAVAMVALVDLAVRSAIRLDLRWDTFSYHLPFAALRGGVSIPYDLNDTIRPLFEGFPPLPDLVQGLLWRLTGSVNATGVVNFIAFALFLIYCHKLLRAPFWLVALISLTAPMVLIHTTVSYVDLFGNAFLAIGVSSCLYAYLFPERPSRAVVVGGLAALAAAAWSKELLVPIVVATLIFFAAIVLRSRAADRFSRRQAAAIVLAFAALAATPYAKNWVEYKNPFWPTRIPIVGALFPYVSDATSTTYAATERPAALKDAPQAEVFVQSLFEVNVPTQYPNRPRWVIDQGNASAGFRMGGFWGFGVMVYLLVTFGMLITYRRRAGIVATVAGLGLLCFVAVLPQSNELRYYMFIPLTWAATIGMLYPNLRDRFPRAGIALLVLVLALFGHMVSQNSTYYQVEKIDYQDAAVAWGAAAYWPSFQLGQTYCAVDMLPIGVMLTGPTMSEYSIVDRSKVSLCPAGTIVVTNAGVQGPYRPESEAQLASDALAAGLKAHQAGNLTEAAKDYEECLKHDATNKYCHFDLGVIAQTQNRPTEAERDYRLALATDPNFGRALFNLAIIRTQAGATQEAIGLYQQFVRLNPNDANGHLNLGLLLRATGDATNGDAEIAKALQLNPKLNVPTSSPSSP